MPAVDAGLMTRLQHLADEFVPDGVRVEVLDGLLVVNPPASLPHAELTDRLGAQLSSRAPAGLTVTVAGAGVYEHSGADAEYQQPDVTVYRRPTDPEALRLTGADVDLVAEVVSPADRRHHDYEGAVVGRAVRYGLPWVAVIDPGPHSIRWWHLGVEQAAGPPWTVGLSLW